MDRRRTDGRLTIAMPRRPAIALRSSRGKDRVEKVSEGNEMLVNVLKKHPYDKVTVSEMISMIR